MNSFIQAHMVKEGRSVRGLNVLGTADARLLAAAGDGRFLINGLRNKDLQAMLFNTPAADAAEAKRRSGQVTRWLWLLRAHGIIRKIGGTHRYLVTEPGRPLITALQAAGNADITKLAQAA